MRPFLLSPEKIEELQKLREYAEAHIYTEADIRDAEVGKTLPLRFRPEFSLEIPVGFGVIFSIDQNRMRNKYTKQWKRCQSRHLSIYLEDFEKHRRFPHPEVIKEVMKILGFSGLLEECIVKKEDDMIVVIEILKDTITDL